MMMIAKGKFVVTALLSAGVMVGGSGYLAARQGPGDAPATNAVVPAATKPDDSFTPRPAAEVSKARLDAAKFRFDAIKATFARGEYTFDRVLDAARDLRDAERDAARTEVARLANARANYARFAELTRIAVAEREVGRETEDNVAQVRSDLLEAELVLAREVEANPKGDELLTGAPGAGLPVDLNTLAGAVEWYGRVGLGNLVPKLTEEEVVAAIRFYRGDRDPIRPFPDGLASSPERLAALQAFRVIAETRRMPPGARFEVEHLIDPGDDQFYEGTFVNLRIVTEGKTRTFPIRSQLRRAVPLEEVVRLLEDQVRGTGKPVDIDPPTSDPAVRAEHLRERIKAKDAKTGR